jgi:hypothetical protein
MKANISTAQLPDAAPAESRTYRSRVVDYAIILKPRVMSLVVFTGLVGLLLAPGAIDILSAIITVACIAAGAGASGAINMWYDRDIDILMARTMDRPIPAARMAPQEALIFGGLLAAVSVAVMATSINLAAAGLLALTILYYVAETPHAAEHRHRGRFGRLSADDRLGGSDRNHRSNLACVVRHHFPMDTTSFLGPSTVQQFRLHAGWRADDAGSCWPRIDQASGALLLMGPGCRDLAALRRRDVRTALRGYSDHVGHSLSSAGLDSTRRRG